MGRTVKPKDDETEDALTPDYSEEEVLVLDAEEQGTPTVESEEDEIPLDDVMSQLDNMFGENPLVDEEEETPDEVFLNCKEFKLMGIQQKKDRKYRISFIADAFTGNTETNLRPEIQADSPFERVLKQITSLVFPLVFPALDGITLISLKRNIKNNKNKELKEFFEFKVRTLDGYGYTAQAKEIDVQDLGDQFRAFFNELENLVHEEISKRHAEDPQLSLFGEIEEGDADEEEAE